MPGLINPDSAKPTPPGTPNGHGNRNSNGNSRFVNDGFTSSSDQSVNDYSAGSESHSEAYEHGAAEPIAIIGMGWLILVCSAVCSANRFQVVAYLVVVRPVPNFGIF
jgi:hypothetical protein